MLIVAPFLLAKLTNGLLGSNHRLHRLPSLLSDILMFPYQHLSPLVFSNFLVPILVDFLPQFGLLLRNSSFSNLYLQSFFLLVHKWHNIILDVIVVLCALFKHHFRLFWILFLNLPIVRVIICRSLLIKNVDRLDNLFLYVSTEELAPCTQILVHCCSHCFAGSSQQQPRF